MLVSTKVSRIQTDTQQVAQKTTETSYKRSFQGTINMEGVFITFYRPLETYVVLYLLFLCSVQLAAVLYVVVFLYLVVFFSDAAVFLS